jgi:hypothetical protein
MKLDERLMFKLYLGMLIMQILNYLIILAIPAFIICYNTYNQKLQKIKVRVKIQK